MNLAVCFNARKASKAKRSVASATIEGANDFSIVADATADIFIAHRALKRTAKFKPPLKR